MRHDPGKFLAAIVSLLACGGAAAEWRCDCTRIVGSCSASATAGESFIEVTSNVEQCARVDYFVDGIPFVALVADGVERQDWIARGESPSIIVSSCQVCLDNSGTSSEPAFDSGIVSAGEPTRLIGVAPIYPPAAVAAGIEGHVDLQFSLSPSGTVVAPEVVASEPAGVFDASALAAVSRWRYTYPSGDTAPVITERIAFNLADEVFSLAARAAAPGEPGAQRGSVRNQCIREESRYDFGTMIDVSLVNACGEPLLVYSCSAGTGTYRERWVCAHSEQSALAPGAALAAGRAAGDQTVAPTSRFEITRAPNGEYWWLACAVLDSACRDDGREWVRTMDRQLANVDPQDRIRRQLARSY
jgi:TonB family protein